MSFCKVHYMNIITDSCSVRCIIIVPEHTQFFKLSYCHL